MRKEAITWEECFMSIALVCAKRSKDPSTQVGACIVNQQNIVIGLGYNGLPRGLSDSEYPWSVKIGEVENTKYPYVVHAELNAILNSSQNLNGATIFVTLFPCNECAKAIIQSGIAKIVYLHTGDQSQSHYISSNKMLAGANVELVSFTNSDLKVDITYD